LEIEEFNPAVTTTKLVNDSKPVVGDNSLYEIVKLNGHTLDMKISYKGESEDIMFYSPQFIPDTRSTKNFKASNDDDEYPSPTRIISTFNKSEHQGYYVYPELNKLNIYSLKLLQPIFNISEKYQIVLNKDEYLNSNEAVGSIGFDNYTFSVYGVSVKGKTQIGWTFKDMREKDFTSERIISPGFKATKISLKKYTHSTGFDFMVLANDETVNVARILWLNIPKKDPQSKYTVLITS
jgi:hypothetical protein